MPPLFWILLGALIGGGVTFLLFVPQKSGCVHVWTNWKRATSVSSEPRWQYRECHSCGFTEAKNL